MQDISNSDIIATGSMAVAICALFTSLWQSFISRRHNILSVRPHLDIAIEVVPGDPIKIILENNGLGTATIQSLTVSINGLKFGLTNRSDYDAITTNITKGIPSIHGIYNAILEKSSLPPSNSFTIIEIGKLSSKEDYERIRKNLVGFSIHIKYKCLYNKNYSFDFSPASFY